MSDVTAAPQDPAPPAPTPPERARRRRWWPWVLLLLLAAGGVWLYHRHQVAARAAAKPPPPRTVPVTTATARLGDIGVYAVALGTVTSVYTVSIYSRVQGQLMQVNYREGQMVRTGDSLVEIDPRPFQAALTQAQGTLQRDRALLSQARMDLERYRLASAKNAISRQQYEDQVKIVEQDEGTVTLDEGGVAAAQVNLIYCHITSPIDGRVGLRLVDPGNIVQANNTVALVTITQLQPITVIFNVSEDYLAQIQAPLRKGERLKVDAYDRTQDKLLASGTLLTLDNSVDTTTGTIRLRAQFANDDLTLFPNQFVNARLLLDTLKNVTLLPTSAIQRNAQGPFVYLIKPDQTATLHSIKVGVTEGNVTSVEGVNPGDVVAASGFDKLTDGSRIRIRTPTAPPANQPSTGPGTDP